eukprot:TRINITY_DN109831_c0_g1_i1.p1 TRINITY_DN109831_c0_g1~~TRINITY_DN109831_c0_g1_i1.p1  ORF type:complete len:587 (-),score=101.46 TRINITY_DN109831_c0_g1_i1:75-1835(-)
MPYGFAKVTVIPQELTWWPGSGAGINALKLYCREGETEAKYEVSGYTAASLGRAFGPLNLERTMLFCSALHKEIGSKTSTTGKPLILSTVACNAEAHTNAATLLGAYLILKRKWKVAQVKKTLGSADASLKFACSWSKVDRQELPRVMTVEHCWKGFEVASAMGWIDELALENDRYMELSCKQYLKWLFTYDSAWLVPGSILICSDPTTTISDPTAGTLERMFPAEEDDKSLSPLGPLSPTDIMSPTDPMSPKSPITRAFWIKEPGTIDVQVDSDEDVDVGLFSMKKVPSMRSVRSHSPRSDLAMTKVPSMRSGGGRSANSKDSSRSAKSAVLQKMASLRIFGKSITTTPKSKQPVGTSSQDSVKNFDSVLSPPVPSEKGPYVSPSETPAVYISEKEALSPVAPSVKSCDTICKEYDASDRCNYCSGNEPPMAFVDFLKGLNVQTLVRVNDKFEIGMRQFSYDEKLVSLHGINHCSVPFPDVFPGIPPKELVKEVIKSCGSVVGNGGAVTFHCKGGFGRSVIMACCLAIHEFDISGEALLGWCRIVRPGAINIPEQEKFLLSLKGKASLQKWLYGSHSCRCFWSRK